MRSILVPVDFSDNAANAARYAADMALAIEADLHLLHIVQVPPTPAEAPVGYVFEQLEENSRALLESLSQELVARTKGQVTVGALQEVGGIGVHIAECCKRLKPFVVIMGAPGGSFVRAFSGSPAVDAARHLPYPVLVIPAGAIFRRIRHIVLACEAGDVGGEIPVALSFLKELKELFGARFEIINVAVGKRDCARDRKVFEVYRWKERLQEVYPELHFVQAPTVLEGVDNYLGERESDWLMLFPKPHGLLEFHRSQSKNLISHCTIPVMSLTEKAG